MCDIMLLLRFVLQLWRAENATGALVTPVFGNVFFAVTSLFFVIGRKEYHFWNQWIILHMTQMKP